MRDYPSTLDSWENTRNGALEKIKRAAKDSDNDLLEDISHKEDPKKKREVQKNCEAVRMLVDKCIEDYRKGEYTFKEAMNELCDALEKIN